LFVKHTRASEGFVVVFQHRAEESSRDPDHGGAGESSHTQHDRSPSARAAVAHARLAALLQAYDEAEAQAVAANDGTPSQDSERPAQNQQLEDSSAHDQLETSQAHQNSFDDPADQQGHETANYDVPMEAGPETSSPPTGEEHLTSEQVAELSGNAPEEEDQSDQRFAARRKTKMKAIIRVAGSQQQTNCTVADISSTGALLKLPVEMHTVSRAGEHVPARFTLFMPTQRTEIDCELAWRSGNRIGARFTSALRQVKTERRERPAARAEKQPTSQGLVGKLFAR
jgi:hypothetical protein